MNRLEVQNLTFKRGATTILHDVSFSVSAGTLMSIVGPSGCGKSTILRCIAGISSIAAGDIILNGSSLNNRRPSDRNCAMVFQSYALYPHMTVFGNIAYPLQLSKLPRREIETRVNEVAERLRIESLLQRKPGDLSGGQRQRVAIGRAMVRRPAVFLFDEPLSNLDADLRTKMRLEMLELKRLSPETVMIYVTHDQTEAMTLSDNILVLKDGVVQQIGTPRHLFEMPDTLFVAEFIGSPRMNILRGAVAGEFEAASIGVRPERVILSFGPILPDSNIQGIVNHVEDLGAEWLAHIRLFDGNTLVVRHQMGNPPDREQQVAITMSRADVHRFDVNGIRMS